MFQAPRGSAPVLSEAPLTTQRFPWTSLLLTASPSLLTMVREFILSVCHILQALYCMSDVFCSNCVLLLC